MLSEWKACSHTTSNTVATTLTLTAHKLQEFKVMSVKKKIQINTKYVFIHLLLCTFSICT